jgi:hypothetical protein
VSALVARIVARGLTERNVLTARAQHWQRNEGRIPIYPRRLKSRCKLQSEVLALQTFRGLQTSKILAGTDLKSFERSTLLNFLNWCLPQQLGQKRKI